MKFFQKYSDFCFYVEQVINRCNVIVTLIFELVMTLQITTVLTIDIRYLNTCIWQVETYYDEKINLFEQNNITIEGHSFQESSEKNNTIHNYSECNENNTNKFEEDENEYNYLFENEDGNNYCIFYNENDNIENYYYDDNGEIHEDNNTDSEDSEQSENYDEYPKHSQVT